MKTKTTVESATPESVWAALRELAEKQSETDRQMKETDRQIKETGREIKETGRQLKKLGIMIGGVSNNHGSFAEEYFINSLKKGKSNFFGERFDKLLKFELIEDKNKTRAECDIILVNCNSIAIIEVKFKVRDKDVDNVTKKVKPFRIKFPEYQNHAIYLGLASMVFDDKVENSCKENGIAVIKQAGDSVIILDENIKTF